MPCSKVNMNTSGLIESLTSARKAQSFPTCPTSHFKRVLCPQLPCLRPPAGCQVLLPQTPAQRMSKTSLRFSAS